MCLGDVRVAVHVALLRNGRTFLLRRRNTGYADGMWCVPTGHVEPGEKLSAAVAREVWEEVAVEVVDASVLEIGTTWRLGPPPRLDVFFECARWVGEPVVAESHRASDGRWFPYVWLPECTVPFVRVALQRFQRGRGGCIRFPEE